MTEHLRPGPNGAVISQGYFCAHCGRVTGLYGHSGSTPTGFMCSPNPDLVKALDDLNGKQKLATSVLLRVGLQVLGATRRGTTDQWGLIGGKLDAGESMVTGAKREFREETGLVLKRDPIAVFTRTCEAGPDGDEYAATTFEVVNYDDLWNAVSSFPVAREVEPGIIVGFVPIDKLLTGPFGAYNKALFDHLKKNPL